MELLNDDLKNIIYNFIPINIKKLTNRESYNNYILSYYPKNIDHWKPFTVYDSDFRNCMNNMFNVILKLKLGIFLFLSCFYYFNVIKIKLLKFNKIFF